MTNESEANGNPSSAQPQADDKKKKNLWTRIVDGPLLTAAIVGLSSGTVGGVLSGIGALIVFMLGVAVVGVLILALGAAIIIAFIAAVLLLLAVIALVIGFIAALIVIVALIVFAIVAIIIALIICVVAIIVAIVIAATGLPAILLYYFWPDPTIGTYFAAELTWAIILVVASIRYAMTPEEDETITIQEG